MARLKATHRGFGINPKIRRISDLKVSAIRVSLFWALSERLEANWTGYR